MYGGDGGNTFVYDLGDGNDRIAQGKHEGGTDILQLGAGIAPSDVIVTHQVADSRNVLIRFVGNDGSILLEDQTGDGGFGIEEVHFADGTVWDKAAIKSHVIVRDADIVGTNISEALTGTSGANQIYGFNGNDTLTGGKGDDYLNGGKDDDTYIFKRGDGADTIYDDRGTDTLQFGADITVTDLVLKASTVDNDFQGLIIGIAGTSDQIYLRNQNQNLGHGIERFVFADGTVLTDADLRAQLMAGVVTDGDDKIYGSNYDDVIDSGNGDDEITSGEGNDTLTGGKGDDYLNGGNDDDTYIFNRGDGADTIYDDRGTDTLQFGEGIDETDIEVSQAFVNGDTNGIVLTVKGASDRVYLQSEFNGNRIDQIRFQSGAVWSVNTLQQLLSGNTVDGSTLSVTMGNDTITGSVGDDNLRGMKGDDVLRGGMGSDTYTVAIGDGHDTIYDPTDANSTDTLILEGINPGDLKVFVSPTDAEDLILYVDDETVIYLDQQNASASTGVEQVQFADGTIWSRAELMAKAGGIGTDGEDTMIGTNFADTLEGGKGNDTLTGGAGNDTYVYNLGDGDDTIFDDNGLGSDPGHAGGSGNFDTLSFGPGISLSDLVLTQPVDGGPLVISFVSQAGSITLDGLDAAGQLGVQMVQFDDGSTVTMDQLLASTLAASETAGDDLVRGFGSNDVLNGGLGDDMLAGGAGSDTYMFELGNGADTITETADGATNTLVFGAGIAATDVRMVRTAGAPDDLILELANGTDQVTLKSQFVNGGAAGIQEIRFDDGTIWQSEDFSAILLAQPATGGADYLVGDGPDDTIDGLAGDDVILGGAGDDTILGSDGNDTLRGGAGDDQLYGGAGDDILSGDTGSDMLDGGDGVDIADYSFSLDSWSIDLGEGSARITTTQNSTQAETLTGIEGVIGGLGSDTIIGNGSSNRIQGGGGSDTLAGAGGDDTFVYDGDESGVDAVDGGAGNDSIVAESDDTVIGLTSLTGVEIITAQGYADVTISTTDDADVLDLSGAVLDGIASINMGQGDDVITGSLGADVINAGDGNDTIRYIGASTGGDQVNGGDGTDTIAAGANDTLIRLASFQNIEAMSGAGFTNVVLARTDADETTDLNGIAISGLAYVDLAGGNDTFIGTAGADVVRGGAGDDILTGSAGDDVFQYAGPDTGYDAIDGGAGNDRLEAVADGSVIGISSINNLEEIDSNGFSNVTIGLGNGDDNLDLTNVTVTGIAAIVGGGGNDTLHGSSGDDTFLVAGANDGIDDLDGSIGQDRILAGADGTIIGVSSIANIETIDGGGYADVHLSTTDGNDTLSLQGVTLTGIKQIDLNAGDDSFSGSSGNDSVSGGSGDDTLSGGAGDDTYLFESGDGNDIIREKDADGIGGGADTLRFGAGILASEVQVTRANNGKDYLLTIANSGGTILIAGGAGNDNADWIENIEFSDGTVWTRDDLDQSVVPFTDGDDNIEGTSASETLRGGDGNDTIKSNGGDDRIYGEAGDDTLFGNSGSDMLFGGSGNDTIYGRDGNDTLTGGTGNDTLFGENGNDTYEYDLGDGSDVISDTVQSSGDTLVFGFGITADDVVVSKINGGQDLRIAIGNDELTIRGGAKSNSSQGVDVVQFSDGTQWSRTQLVDRASLNYAPTRLSLSSYQIIPTLSGVGASARLSGNEYQLTPNNGNVVGAVWGAVDLSQDVTWSTEIFFGGNDRGADGVSFSLQNVSATELGDSGTLLPNSLGIWFDTYSNSGEPNSDFSEIVLGGNIGDQVFDAYHTHSNLENNAWHDVVIHWDSTKSALSYSLDGAVVAEKKFDVVSSLFSGDSSAYFGFGARTGGAANYQAVKLNGVSTSGAQLLVADDAVGGAVVGQFSTADANFGDQFSYSIVDQSGAAIEDDYFTISGDQLVVKSGADLSLINDSDYSLSVMTTDLGGASLVQDFDIHIAPETALPLGPSSLELLAPVAPDLSLVGNATELADGTYRLTPYAGNQNGAIWGALDLTKDAEWITQMYFGSSDRGADGIAFALQGSGDTVLGNTGVLTSQSLGIKFDTYTNNGEPGSDFSKLVLNGNVSSQSFDAYHTHSNIEDNAWHDVIIRWDSDDRSLTYSLDGTEVATRALNANADPLAGLGSAFFGFGASTGGASNEQKVDVESMLVSASSLAVMENAAGGTLVGVVRPVSALAEASYSFAIVDSNDVEVTDSPFEIDGSGQLRVKDGAVLDFDSINSYDINVKATDDAGRSYTQDITINLVDQPGATIVGTADDDVLLGTSEDDTTSGGDGNYTLRGQQGSDSLDGVSGNDTAVFAGAMADYSISTAGGSVNVIDDQLTSDGDGKLSSLYDEWAKFGVWNDRNSNWQVDPGEFLSMAHADMSALDLTDTPTDETHQLGENLVNNSGTFTHIDGTFGHFDDAAFAYGHNRGAIERRMPELPFRRRLLESEFTDVDQLGKLRPAFIDAERFIQAAAAFGLQGIGEFDTDNESVSMTHPRNWDVASSKLASF
ncbi:calcium-binding protein [Altericroceibacterium endophyticum]|uniref:Cadherin domain-containing protein n=1 Tax=Altericroceibacterium endophyticum TaxID=1808508 RepID=A0A6I4T5I2_9SPHN|nr:calcium-binding protein [Altericroceibacterium endophyticum]MXO65948.1 hypothetical protein [Altericroceibacterium endophyticum]